MYKIPEKMQRTEETIKRSKFIASLAHAPTEEDARIFISNIKNEFPRFNFLDYPSLEFEPPNTKIFRNLALSFEAMDKGGNVPCILNAANEVVVEAFLQRKIKFLQMSELIEKAMNEVAFIEKPSLDDLIETNNETRRVTELLTGNCN